VLVHSVITQLEREADPQVAQLRYENQLKRYVDEHQGLRHSSREQRPPALRPAFKLMAFCAALFLMASAANYEFSAWDDGQQLTIALPGGFEQSEYNQWVALFANRSRSLADSGGHSLVVDYVPSASGHFMLQLSILGVDCATADSWFREVLASTPKLEGARYGITQPQVSYSLSVREMLAYELGGRTDSVERRVLRAWSLLGDAPGHNGVIYLIASSDQYPRRASMLR
jgi:hypothetical protein